MAAAPPLLPIRSGNGSGGGSGGSKSSLGSRLRALRDGEATVVEWGAEPAAAVVAVRAGQETFHPLKVSADLLGRDVIFLSSAEGGDSAAVEAVAASMRRPRRCRNPPAGPLRALADVCPVLHPRILDPSQLIPMPVTAARALLAELATSSDPQPTPLVLVACTPEDGGESTKEEEKWAEEEGELVFIGQVEDPAPSRSFHVVTVRVRRALDGSSADHLKLAEDIVGASGGSLRARALFELWGDPIPPLGMGRGGLLTVGAVVDPTSGTSFAHLVTEWDAHFHRPKSLTVSPPGICRSVLFVGGTAPLSSVSFRLRASLEVIHNQHRLYQGHTTSTSVGGGGGGGGGGRSSSSSSFIGSSSGGIEGRLKRELENLMSKKEGIGEMDAMSDVVLPAAASATGSLPAAESRSDLDFSEKLWQSILSQLCTIDQLVYVFRHVLLAVEQGRFFPHVHEDNKSMLGLLLYQGVERAQALRYSSNNSEEAGAGAGTTTAASGSSPSSKIWKDKWEELVRHHSPSMCVDLGLHKLRGDLIHWFHLEVGISSPDLEWFIKVDENDYAAAAAAADTLEEAMDSAQVLSERLRRLAILVNALEIVTLAQTCGASWQECRAVAMEALSKYSLDSTTDEIRRASVFAAALPQAIPSGVRSRFSLPLFWELSAEGSSDQQSACLVLPGANWPASRGGEASDENDRANKNSVAMYTIEKRKVA